MAGGEALPAPGGDRSGRLRRLGDLAVREGPVVVFVTAVVALMILFRQLADAGLAPEVLSVTEFAEVYAADFLKHLVAALLMLLVIEPVRRRGPAEGWRRSLLLAMAAAVAASLAATSYAAWLVGLVGRSPESVWPAWPTYFLRFQLLAWLLLAVGEFHRAEVRGLEAMRRTDADRAALEQQTLLARLKTLEAQIEPHFLFNTLANVRRLYETDPVAGEAMLERMTRYLKVALPSLRNDRSTLAREAELIESYLELQHVRMGRRLAYRIDVAPALRQIEVPPLMLLTLVENAIKHGLAPQREGGRIEVGARLDGATLVLEVADTGRGFGGDSAGGGTGLANLRARLAAMFGAAAEFSLAAGDPRGLRATIRMPAAMPAAA